MSSFVQPTADVIRLANDHDALAVGPVLREEIIRRLAGSSKRQEVIEEGQPPFQWSKSLPSVVLYEGKGIDLYEEITRSEHYYLYDQELNVIKANQFDIASSILKNRRPREEDYNHLLLADLGAGRLDKAIVILRSMHALRTRKVAATINGLLPLVTYCAVDIQYDNLCDRLVKAVNTNSSLLRHVHSASNKDHVAAVCGVCSSYQSFRELFVGTTAPAIDCVRALNVQSHDTCSKSGSGSESEDSSSHSKLDVADGFHGRKCLLWLGSSFTNLQPQDAAKFLAEYIADGMMRQADTMIIGLDKCQDVGKVKLAYSEEDPTWQKYISNAMASAGRILGGEAARLMSTEGQWEYVSRWNRDESSHMRYAVARMPIAFSVDGQDGNRTHIDIARGEPIFLCQSYKYTSATVEKVFDAAGLRLLKEWQSDGNDCSVYFLALK